MRAVLVTCLATLAACGGEKLHDSPQNVAAQPTCAARAAALKSDLAQIFDPAAKPRPPWPTGDAATDRAIEAYRAEDRDWLKPRDPAAQRAPLSAGVKPGHIEHELAPCPEALAQLKHVGDVSPGESRAAMVAIADRIGACGCTVNLPLVDALFYMFARGPD